MPGFELIGDEERQAVNRLFDDGAVLFAHGFDKLRNGRYHVREFESKFAKRMGVKYAQAVSSGTAAIKISLISMGVKPGDEVITQAFTFIATLEAIIDIGAKPVLANIDKSLNMDPNELESLITNKTKVIMPVHMLGVSCEQDKILKIAKKHKLFVLDDSCEALGAEWRGQPLGISSDISTWSFDHGKTIVCGEGGMITTNNKELYLLAKEYHDHGHMNNKDFSRGKDTHRIIGFNYRMTEIQAVIASAQLDKIDYIVEKNREHYSYLHSELSSLNHIEFRKIPSKCNPLCDTLIIIFDSNRKANKLVKLLTENELSTKNVPDAIEWHFAKYWHHMLKDIQMSQDELQSYLLPSSEIIERSVAFPIMVSIKPLDLKYQVEKIRDLVEIVLQEK
jgi:8-amino-3,8-dideoxy-alpha-D-manno-octulosonate transaminase